MPQRINIAEWVGREFDRLTIIGKGAPSHVTVRCVCGVVKDVRLKQIVRSKHATVSCGCQRREMLKAGMRKTRGQSKTRTYSIYLKMVNRSTNPADEHWDDYGGRGIGLCDRWRTFENFSADMGTCPDGLTIERENNNKGYSPDNCKWATMKEQNFNRRSNRRSLFNGENLTQTEIAIKTGRHKTTIYRRMKMGYTPEQIASPQGKLTGDKI